ncbi:MAG: DUF2207 domain-containing protein [Ilumatobacteraceae bacterium]
MLNPVGALRHLAAAAAAAAAPVLVVAGVLGQGVHPERFDAKQVVVAPLGDGVRIREVVDQDFGNHQRHGYERVIPTDFGAATDVTASSPDAPDDLSVVNEGYQTRIRIGDPDTTIDGQHRYVLTYTLPSAQLSTGQLALDIIWPDEPFETGRFEVVLTGFELRNPLCNVGRGGTSGGCTLQQVGDEYRVVFQPLEAGDGITVGGQIVRTFTPAEVAVPPIPARRGDASGLLVAGVGVTGVGAAAGTFLVARRLGRNKVAGGGAADAAYGGGGPALLMSDSAMEDFVTTEFVPPPSMTPWEGAMLLRERVDNQTVEAWYATQIAREALVLQPGSPATLAAGPKLQMLGGEDRARLNALVSGSTPTITLDKYQPRLASLTAKVRKAQIAKAKKSNWWEKFPPGSQVHFPPAIMGVFALAALGVVLAVWAGWRQHVLVAFGVALGGTMAVAMAAYLPLLPVRSVQGSALAIRVESFRRFLLASEGKHVDWAWQQGILREYTAWAVALGAADAWGRALAASTIPPPQMSQFTAPLLAHTYWSSLQTSSRMPSSNSGSGGSGGWGGGGFSGGFSGGSVGGGGGGGSSGSW